MSRPEPDHPLSDDEYLEYVMETAASYGLVESSASVHEAASREADSQSTLSRNPELIDLMNTICRHAFMDAQELASCMGVSTSTTYHRLTRLKDFGLIGRVPHQVGPLALASRTFPTKEGIEATARARRLTPLQCARQCAITAPQMQRMIRRIDGIAIIYRLASAFAKLSKDLVPVFTEIRSRGPFDAMLRLKGGQTIGVMRQGRARSRSAFGRRLDALAGQSESDRPGVAIILSDTESDSEYAFQYLDAVEGYPNFVGVEDDVVGGPTENWSLYDLDGNGLYVEDLLPELLVNPGRAPVDRPITRIGVVPDSSALVTDQPQFALECAQKDLLNLYFDWPLMRKDLLSSWLGVTDRRVAQITNPLLDRGLITVAATVRDLVYYALSDSGLTYVADRDRTSHGPVDQRLSVVGPTPDRWFGGTVRKSWRDRPHTDGVHWILSRLTEEARADERYDQLRVDPPIRSIREYSTDDDKGRIEPDASGLIRYEDDDDELWIPFVLERECGDVSPGRARRKVRLYQRFWASGSQRDAQGAAPVVLFVFDTPDDEKTFHDTVCDEEDDDQDVRVPFATACVERLGRTGVLGHTWQLPEDGDELVDLSAIETDIAGEDDEEDDTIQ